VPRAAIQAIAGPSGHVTTEHVALDDGRALLTGFLPVFHAAFPWDQRVQDVDAIALDRLRQTMGHARVVLARLDGRPVGYVLHSRQSRSGAHKVFGWAIHPDYDPLVIGPPLARATLDRVPLHHPYVLLQGISGYRQSTLGLAQQLGGVVDAAHVIFRQRFDGKPVTPKRFTLWDQSVGNQRPNSFSATEDTSLAASAAADTGPSGSSSRRG